MNERSEAKKEEFCGLFNEFILGRHGADNLLGWLEQTDFFIAPASTRYHLAYEGGLCEHSINVYYRLNNLLYVSGEYDLYSKTETVAIVSLLHDVCKAECYIPAFRNRKNYSQQAISKADKKDIKHDLGGDFVWECEQTYEFDELFTYGHGEKSVLLIQDHMRLTHEEAQAIRYHMGTWNTDDSRSVGKVYENNKLAFLLSVADQMATFIDETGD